jgi:hypothetical protein
MGRDMKRSVDFNRFATECVRIAEDVESIDDKALLLSMAEVWIMLGDKADGVHALIQDPA